MSRRMRVGVVFTLVAVGSFLVATHGAVAKEKKKPDGTVKLSGGSVAAGIGFSWGSGELTYKGKKYPFSIDGISVGSVGISNADATGKVYHLKKLEDFNGNYTSAAAGATVAGGASAATMKNQNGVVIDLVSTTRGVKLTLAVSGVKIELKNE
jgi:hypothetical protein